MSDHVWSVYLGVFLGPFVQEDAAIFGAAASAAAKLASPLGLYLVALVGVTCSDVWKYWAGRLAGKHAWARRMADKPQVRAAREKVLHHLGPTMLVARFVPGTRIPLYVACGVFRAPFLPFLTYIVLTAALYLAVAFTLVNWLGQVLGAKAAHWTPLIVVGLVLCLVLGRLLFSRLRPVTAKI